MSTEPNAGWYPDPFGRFERRYFDSTWTHHVYSGGAQSIDPPVAASPQPTGPKAHFRADWYPDPFRRYERRFWDGRQWTHHVATQGRQAIDRAAQAAPRDVAVVEQIHRAGIIPAGSHGESPLLTQRVLVVNQKAKLFERRAEYGVFDEFGRRIGAVQEVDRGVMRKATGGSANGTVRFNVVDVQNRVVLKLRRPAKLLKSRMIVIGANGVQGEIVQRNVGVFTAVRFGLESAGQEVGSIVPDDRREWDFGIRDAAGVEVGRITKTWAGWAKERFTKADNYVVEIHRPLQDPLRTLVLATALAIDTALKQGEPTRGKGRRRRYK